MYTHRNDEGFAARAFGLARFRRLPCVYVLAASALLTGCDKDESNQTPAPPPPSGGGTSGVIEVTGTERIGWTQGAASFDTLRRYRFVAVVDDERSTLSNASCGTAAGPTGYDCSAPLPRMSPGRHVFQLIAVDEATSRESARSGALNLNVVSRLTAEVVATVAPATPPIPDRTCVDGEETATCFAVEVVAEGMRRPRGLAAMDGERLLIAEADRVLALEGRRLTESYRASHDGAQELLSIAVDPEFHTNRLTYAAVARTDSGGARTVSVLRLREVAGTLGEAATIVPGQPLAAEGTVALATGPDRNIYLAVPGSTGPPAYGAVMRFDQDGAATGRADIASPVLAQARPYPSKLAWDGGDLWLGARREPAASALTLVDLGNRQPWPARPLAVSMDGWPAPEAGVQDLAVATGDARSRLYVVLEDGGAMYATQAAGAGVRTLGPLRRVPLGSTYPVAVATASGGTLYVSVASGPDLDASQYILLRLRPDRAAGVGR